LLVKNKGVDGPLTGEVNIYIESKKMSVLRFPNLLVRWIKATLAGLFTLHIGGILLLAPLIFSFRYWTPPVTSLMVYRALYNGYSVRPIQTVSLNKLPRWVPKLFIYLEDRRFYQHWGLDLEAIKTAYERNKQLRYPAFGGSTITQQLSRTLFLTPHKNIFRKYVEAFIAIEMDALLPKERILELYLNLIEWGPGVFGLGNAARLYYRTKPEALTLEQYCRLAAVLPNPLSFTVSTLQKHRGMWQRYQSLLRVFS
ncbi:MAG: biosynthetic peptidoglycan transglycosylase, partial [Spirochaetales bacterium]